MARFNNKESGLTGIGFVFVLLILGFFVALGLKLFPVYLEYYSVTTSLQSLKNEESSKLDQSQAIKSLLKKRLDMNDVTHVSNENIKIVKNVKSTTVTVEYEVRKSFMGNVDIVVSFSDSIELTAN